MRRNPILTLLSLSLLAAIAACGDDGETTADTGDTSSDTGAQDGGGDAGSPDVSNDGGATDADDDSGGEDARTDTSIPDVSNDASDATSDTALPNDSDDDGVPADLDCDDTDAQLGAIAFDADCDGVLTEVDCEDADPSTIATNLDEDGDGFTGCDGDCCDNTDVCANPELVNPGAAEWIDGDAVDDDCDGSIDEVSTSCDEGIALDSASVDDASATIGVCDQTTLDGGYGLVSARWIRANGADAASSTQNGMTGQFGDLVGPQEGERMLVLSTGRARDEDDPDYCASVTCTGSGEATLPPGFPLDIPDCAPSDTGNDDAAFEITLRAPTNATGLSVDVRMFAQDYPELVCNEYNDQAIVLMSPAPAGSISGNIAFDSRGVPLGVNYEPLDTCAGCSLGAAELAGTGFDRPSGGAATSWRRVTAPVTPGTTFTLRFMIWDTGDQNFDSTLLVDNFQWVFGEAPTVQTVAAP